MAGRMHPSRMSRSGSRTMSAANLSTSYHRARTVSGLGNGLIESVTLKLKAEATET